MLNVVVADAQRLFAQSLAVALADSPELCVLDHAATTGLEAVESVLTHRPDVAVLDYWMTGMDGAAATTRILASSPDTKVVILAWLHGPAQVRHAMAAGASVLVTKKSSLAELHGVIRRVGAGETVLPGSGPPAPGPAAARLAPREDLTLALTTRELEILQMLSQTSSRREVADRLGIAERTLARHVHHILGKTGARTLIEALSLARREGVIRDAGCLPGTGLAPARSLTSPSTNGAGHRGPPKSRVKVFVADAQRLFAEALGVALDQDASFLVVGECPTTGAEAVAAAERHRPDVVVLDHWILGIGQDGPATIREMLAAQPGVAVLLTSWAHGVDHIRAGLNAGAVGFLPKSLTLDQVIHVVDLAAQGDSLVYGDKLADLVEDLERRGAESEQQWERLQTLTRSEARLLQLLSEGRPGKETARVLCISLGTLKNYVHAILRKTGAANQLELILMARRAGAIFPPSPSAGLPRSRRTT